MKGKYPIPCDVPIHQCDKEGADALDFKLKGDADSRQCTGAYPLLLFTMHMLHRHVHMHGHRHGHKHVHIHGHKHRPRHTETDTGTDRNTHVTLL